MKKIAVISLLALAFSSCATTFTTTNGKLAYASIQGAEKGTIAAAERNIYVFHPSLLSITKPNEKLDELIEPQLTAKGANAVKDLKVVYNHDFLAFLVNWITGGLIGAPNVEVTGTAVSE